MTGRHVAEEITNGELPVDADLEAESDERDPAVVYEVDN
jgi:hypothetical protein